MPQYTIKFAMSAMLAVALAPLSIHAGDVLTGAGATFPSPLYREWIDQFKTDSGIRIRYESVGSGAGIRMLKEKVVDFGATDAFLSDREMAEIEGEVLHIPTCLGAVSVIYNLDGHPRLRLSGETVAAIYSGAVAAWSDDRIAADNPDIVLPDAPITVVHRADSSGTTFIFSDYLSKISCSWRRQYGHGKTIEWASGLGADGNPGVARLVARIPGGIGYVSLNYARQHNLPAAAIRNRAGRFISPSPASVSRAAEAPLPDDTRILITDTDAMDGYPISGFTWLIFYKEQKYADRSLQKARALHRFLTWIVERGQSFASRMHYAPLSRSAIEKAGGVIDSLRHGARPLDDIH